MAPAVCVLERFQRTVCGGFLAPCAVPPSVLDAPHAFVHHTVHTHWPMRPATARDRVCRRHPPHGIELWPGHPLTIRLLVPAPPGRRLTPASWPLAAQPLYLRRWTLVPCPQLHARWVPEPHWLPASSLHWQACAVHRHRTSGLAEWTFLLTEPCPLVPASRR